MTKEEAYKKYGLTGEKLPDIKHNPVPQTQTTEEMTKEILEQLPMTFEKLRQL